MNRRMLLSLIPTTLLSFLPFTKAKEVVTSHIATYHLSVTGRKVTDVHEVRHPREDIPEIELANDASIFDQIWELRDGLLYSNRNPSDYAIIIPARFRDELFSEDGERRLRERCPLHGLEWGLSSIADDLILVPRKHLDATLFGLSLIDQPVRRVVNI